MPQFLTVKEAALLTGKSTSSIRRIIYPIIHDDQHPDRAEIQPDIARVQELRMKGENFAWRVSEELLRREVPVDNTPQKETPTAREGTGSHANSELLAMLRGELDIKNRQITQQSELIATQMQLIGGLSERLREGNILMSSLQKQLPSPEGRSRVTPETRDAKVEKPAAKEKGSKANKKTAKQKRGFRDWLFG